MTPTIYSPIDIQNLGAGIEYRLRFAVQYMQRVDDKRSPSVREQVASLAEMLRKDQRDLGRLVKSLGAVFEVQA